jgi:hypothetical protein
MIKKPYHTMVSRWVAEGTEAMTVSLLKEV